MQRRGPRQGRPRQQVPPEPPKSGLPKWAIVVIVVVVLAIIGAILGPPKEKQASQDEEQNPKPSVMDDIRAARQRDQAEFGRLSLEYGTKHEEIIRLEKAQQFDEALVIIGEVEQIIVELRALGERRWSEDQKLSIQFFGAYRKLNRLHKAEYDKLIQARAHLRSARDFAKAQQWGASRKELRAAETVFSSMTGDNMRVEVGAQAETAKDALRKLKQFVAQQDPGGGR